MHTAEDNQLTIVVYEHFSQLVKWPVTYASGLLNSFFPKEIAVKNGQIKVAFILGKSVLYSQMEWL